MLRRNVSTFACVPEDRHLDPVPCHSTNFYTPEGRRVIMDVSAVPCVAWGVHRVGLMKRSVSVAMRKIASGPAGRHLLHWAGCCHLHRQSRVIRLVESLDVSAMLHSYRGEYSGHKYGVKLMSSKCRTCLPKEDRTYFLCCHEMNSCHPQLPAI